MDTLGAPATAGADGGTTRGSVGGRGQYRCHGCRQDERQAVSWGGSALPALSTIKKIGPVLDLFTVDTPQWRMTDIARALDMPKSSAHALVATLAEVGLLSVGPDGLYGLGWNLLSLSDRMRAGLEFRQHALPHMHELAGELGETVLLAVLDASDVIYLERVEGTHAMVRLAGVQIGARMPAYCTGVGRALLAHCEPLEVRALHPSETLEARTPHTITSIEELETALMQTRRSGGGVRPRRVRSRYRVRGRPD